MDDITNDTSALHRTESASAEFNSKAIATQLLIAHYNAIRENILEFVKMRDRYVYFTILALGAIFSVAIANEKKSHLLFATPFVCLISSLLYLQVEMSIGAMARWLKTEYSEDVEKFTGMQIRHWDSSSIGSLYFSQTVLGKRAVSLALLYLICNVSAGLMMWVDYKFTLPTFFERKTDGDLFFSHYYYYGMIYTLATLVSFVFLARLTAMRKAIHFAPLPIENSK